MLVLFGGVSLLLEWGHVPIGLQDSSEYSSQMWRHSSIIVNLVDSEIDEENPNLECWFLH